MKNIIITGASGNMGQAVVRKFIEADWKVIGTVIPNDPVAMDFPVDLFEKKIVDLTNEEHTQQFVTDIIAKYHSVDAAVLTVGGFAMGEIATTKTSDILKQFKLNFETAYNIARPVFLQMLAQGNGRIFVIGARPGISAKEGKGMIAYGLAKSLLFRLAEQMNEEAHGKNIVTSVVVPGTIDTPQNRKSMPDADFSHWVKPDSIASSIYYHCSEEAASIREPVIKLYGNG